MPAGAGQYRHAPSLSPPPSHSTTAPSPSVIYSDDQQLNSSHDQHTLSLDAAHNNDDDDDNNQQQQDATNDGIDEADSLLDATDDQVEARALAFLDLTTAGDVLPPTSSSPKDANAPSLDPFKLPLVDDLSTVDLNKENHELAKQAQAFLRSCVDKADDDDWMYDTPPVFRSPNTVRAPASSSSATQFDLASGTGTSVNGGTGWLEQAFNTDSFGGPHDHDDSTGARADAIDELLFDLAASHEARTRGHHHPPPAPSQMGAAAGAASGYEHVPMERRETTGLTRGVSQMAM